MIEKNSFETNDTLLFRFNEKKIVQYYECNLVHR